MTKGRIVTCGAADFNGPVDTIEYTNAYDWWGGGRIRKGDGLFAFVFHNVAGEPPVAGIVPNNLTQGVWLLPNCEHAETLTVAASAEPRDVNVTFALGGVEDDPYRLKVEADTMSVTETPSTPSIGLQAHIDTVTLCDVPGDVTQVIAYAAGDRYGLNEESIFYAGVNVWVVETSVSAKRKLR